MFIWLWRLFLEACPINSLPKGFNWAQNSMKCSSQVKKKKKKSYTSFSFSKICETEMYLKETDSCSMSITIQQGVFPAEEIPRLVTIPRFFFTHLPFSDSCNLNSTAEAKHYSGMWNFQGAIKHKMFKVTFKNSKCTSPIITRNNRELKPYNHAEGGLNTIRCK